MDIFQREFQPYPFRLNPKFGFETGVFVSIPVGNNLGKYLGLQLEVLYSQRGFNARGHVFDGHQVLHYNMTRRISYLDIPILFAFKPSNLVYWLVGIQLSNQIGYREVYADIKTAYQQAYYFSNDFILKDPWNFVSGFDLNLNYLVFGFRTGIDLRSTKDGGPSTFQYKNVWAKATIGIRFYKSTRTRVK